MYSINDILFDELFKEIFQTVPGTIILFIIHLLFTEY